jgi:ABC-type hemin transport system ATPase subunit
VLHDLNLAASLADRICLMARGAVVAMGPVDEVLIPSNLEQVYGLPIGVTHLPDGRPLCYLPV